MLFIQRYFRKIIAAVCVGIPAFCCAAELKFGDQSVSLYSDKKSNPAIAVNMNGVVYYGYLTPGIYAGKININYNSQIYHLTNISTGPGAVCSDGNKNLCNAGSLCWYANKTYIAWDGTIAGGAVIDGKVVNRAKPNNYGIRAITWACRSSNSASTNSGQCDDGRKAYCWCSFSKDPDTDPDTFVSGKWSSWVFGYSYINNSDSDDCYTSCAAACTDRVNAASVGGAVTWD
ncbi:MAG: hypothetical protein LBK26_02310 [Rickettsiales bacterium]|jgi:hypothetical protein|nr:hypothetical protein [Rickettsiales bacterium]